MKRVVVLLSLLLSVARPAATQTVGSTSGTINGRVTDNSGAVLPGVTVTITSPAMMGVRTAVTNEEGLFRFPAVEPGDYKVTFELAGFSRVDLEGIHVGLAFTATVNAEMKVAAIQETVTVSGVSPVVDTEATKVTSVFSSDTLKNLPFTGEYWAMLSATPAVQMSSVDVGGSQALTPNGYIVYGMSNQHRPMVEGMVATWGPGSADMYYADFNSFEETALNAVGNNAEAPSPGMQSNYISKSGGNQFHGSVYFDYESGTIQAHNIDSAQLATGITGGNGVAPVDTNRLLSYRHGSADIGGYVLKDKLWWYFSYSNLGNDVRLVNVIGTSKTSVDPTYSGKVTYNLTSTGHLIGYYQGTNKQVNPYLSGGELQAVSSGSAIWNPGSPWLQKYPAGVYKGEYDQTLSSNAFMEVRAGDWYAHWANDSLSPGAYRYEDIGTNVVTGGGRVYNDIRDRPQVSGSFSYYKDHWGGSHNFKVGFEMLRETDDQFDGGFLGNIDMILKNGVPNQVYIFQSPNNEQNGLWARSGYLTDSWRVSQRLTLNLGVRYDRYQPFLDAQQHQAGPNNPTAISFPAANSLLTWNEVAPRVGAVYDLTGKSKTLVKVNYGNYYWNPASDFAGTLNPNQVLWYSKYSWSDPGCGSNCVFQPGQQGTLLATNGGVASQVIDPNLKDEYTTQATAFLEHELMRNFGIRTGFVWMGDRDLRANVNLNQPFAAFEVPVTLQVPGPTGTGSVGTVSAFNLAAPYVGLPNKNLVENLSGAQDNYYTWELTANKRMSNRWSMIASFAETWNQVSVLALNPNQLINTVNGQNRYTEWQAKVSGTFQLPMDFRLSPFVRYQAGTTFGRTFVGALNYGSPSILAEPFNTERNQTAAVYDLRLEKGIRVYGRRAAGFIDVYNIFNANPATAVGTASGANFLRPTTIVPPRIARFGVKLDW